MQPVMVKWGPRGLLQQCLMVRQPMPAQYMCVYFLSALQSVSVMQRYTNTYCVNCPAHGELGMCMATLASPKQSVVSILMWPIYADIVCKHAAQHHEI